MQEANNISTEMHEKTERWAYASVNSTCTQQTPHPPSWADPRALALFCLGWQISGCGDSWAVNFPGVGTEKEGKYPSSVNTATFFIDRTVE